MQSLFRIRRATATATTTTTTTRGHDGRHNKTARNLIVVLLFSEVFLVVFFVAMKDRTQPATTEWRRIGSNKW
jgi:hypothetical protein